MKISYNEKVFFNPPKEINNKMTHDTETISKLINNVINSANTGSNSQNFKDSSSIKFNVNINNNYFNSNYNYVINEQQPIKQKKDEGGFTGFFSI